MITTMEVHEQFLMLRAWKKISKKEVAELLGCHENTVSRFETGKRVYSDVADKARALAEQWQAEFDARHEADAE